MSGWILVLLLFGLNGLLGLMTGEIYLPNKKGAAEHYTALPPE